MSSPRDAIGFDSTIPDFREAEAGKPACAVASGMAVTRTTRHFGSPDSKPKNFALHEGLFNRVLLE